MRLDAHTWQQTVSSLAASGQLAMPLTTLMMRHMQASFFTAPPAEVALTDWVLFSR